jgi:uncharacterized protein (TIGR03067 family)
MRTIVAMATLMMLLAGRVATVRAETEGDRDKVQGEWVLSAGEKGGRKAPGEGLKDVTVTFSGGTFTWKSGEKDTQGTFSLDLTKSPREISVSVEGKKLDGIYRLEGDKLKICVGADDDRPADFATKEGTKSVLWILTRKKP